MEGALANFLGLGMPALGAVGAAISTYWKDQHVKRMEQRRQQEKELRRHKEVLYSKLQSSVFDLWAAKGIAEREVDALLNISDAWIFASDNVLHQVNRFMQTYDNSRRNREDVSKRSEMLQPIVAELFLRMRKDLFTTETELTTKEAEDSVGYYSWVGEPG